MTANARIYPIVFGQGGTLLRQVTAQQAQRVWLDGFADQADLMNCDWSLIERMLGKPEPVKRVDKFTPCGRFLSWRLGRAFKPKTVVSTGRALLVCALALSIIQAAVILYKIFH